MTEGTTRSRRAARNVRVDRLADYGQRNRMLEWRSQWFTLSRTADERVLSRQVETALERKAAMIKRQAETAPDIAAYNPAGAGSPWYSVGPRNVNGRVRCLAVDPTNSDIVYCGSASGGVWKTIDGAQTWRPLWDMQESLAVGAIAVAPSQPATVYVGTGEGLIAGSYGSYHNFPGAGVFVSNDSGATWTRRAGATNRRITQLLVAHDDPLRLYVAGQSGFERSTDGGLTWTTVHAGQVSDAVIHPHDSSVLYIAIQNDGVYKSTDQGVTWSALTTAPTGVSAQWPKLAIGDSGTHGGDFVLVKSGGTIYRSIDAGVTFSVVSGAHGSYYLGWCDLLAVAPDNEQIILWGGVDLERTTDGGATWTMLGSLHSDQHQAVFAPSNPSIVYEGNDGGLYRSTDHGATWNLTSNGLVITQFYNVGDWGPISTVLGGGTQDQGTNMTTSGLTWKNILGWDGGYLVIDYTDPHVMYAEHQSTDIFKSTDGGASWVSKSSGLSGTSPWVGVLTMDPSNHNRLFTGKTCVYRSLDALATAWTASSQDFGFDVSSIAVAPSDSNRVYAGTGDLYLRTGQGLVFRSDDAGATMPWADKTTGTLPSSRPVMDIVVDRTNRDRVVVAYGSTNSGAGANAIFLSTNGGNTWTDISGDLPNVSVNAIALDPNTANTVYIGTDTGIFRTTNLGTNWLIFDNGIPNVPITDLIVDPTTNMLYCATFGRGMYKLDITPGLTKAEVDLYIRDSVLDTGERFPSPNDQPNPVDVSDRVYWYTSPDVKVNPPPYFTPSGVFDGVDFDTQLNHLDPRRTLANRFYLQVHNRGWRTTTNVRVRAFVADASAGLPSLPNALTPPDFNLSSAANWTPIGPAQTIPTLEPNRPVVVTWDFTLPATQATHSCVLAVLSSPDDPMVNPQTDVNVLVDTEKHVGLKNLHVIDAGPSPAPVMVTVDFHNVLREAELIDIVVQPLNFGRGSIGMLLPPLDSQDEQLELLGVTRYSLRPREWLGAWYTADGEEDRQKLLERNFRNIDRSTVYELDPTKQSEIRGIRMKAGQSIRSVIACRGTGGLPYGTTQRFAVLQRQRGQIIGGSIFEVRPKRAAGLYPVSHIRLELDELRLMRGSEAYEDEPAPLVVTVSINDDACRTYQHVLPAGTRRDLKEQNRCLFDGYVAEEDRLTVSAREAEEDSGRSGSYVRRFGGPPETWVGEYRARSDGPPATIDIAYRITSLPLATTPSAD